MRSFLTLVAIVVSGNAQAQFPYNMRHTLHAIHQMARMARLPRTDSQQSMAQEMLNAHNTIRPEVGVPPLVWSDQLAQVAKDWANHLIATVPAGHATGVVDLWAKEARGYDNTLFQRLRGTTRRSSGPRPAPSAALSPGMHRARSGSATTIPQKRHRVPTILSR